MVALGNAELARDRAARRRRSGTRAPASRRRMIPRRGGRSATSACKRGTYELAVPEYQAALDDRLDMSDVELALRASARRCSTWHSATTTPSRCTTARRGARPRVRARAARASATCYYRSGVRGRDGASPRRRPAAREVRAADAERPARAGASTAARCCYLGLRDESLDGDEHRRSSSARQDARRCIRDARPASTSTATSYDARRWRTTSGGTPSAEDELCIAQLYVLQEQAGAGRVAVRATSS